MKPGGRVRKFFWVWPKNSGNLSGRLASAAPFCAAVDHSSTLRKLMLHYLQTKLIHSRQTAYTNAAYNMDVRLARWLLMCHDRLDGDEIPVTREFIP